MNRIVKEIYNCLPTDWRVANITELLVKNNSIKIGPFGSQLKKEILVKEGYKVYGQENVIAEDFTLGNRHLTESKFKELKSCEILEGDVLISMMGTVGKCVVVPNDIKPGIMDSHLIRIRVNEEIYDKTLLIQLIQHSTLIKKQIKRLSVGGIMEGLSSSIVKELFFPKPPFAEQQKIAQILSNWDKVIGMTERLIQAKTQLKKGLMQKLLIGKMRFKEFEGEDWKEYIFGNLGVFYNGLTGKSKEDFGSGYPYIPFLNIINNSKINPEQMDYVKIRPDEKQNNVKCGDIFFTTSSETPEEAGMPSVLLDHLDTTFLNSFCFGYRLHDFSSLFPPFARFYLRSYLVRKDIYRLAQGSTRYNISKSEIMKVRLLLPSVDEQYKIASFLSNIEDELNILNNTMIKFKDQKKGLMQKLLTGEVRVKTD